MGENFPLVTRRKKSFVLYTLLLKSFLSVARPTESSVLYCVVWAKTFRWSPDQRKVLCCASFELYTLLLKNFRSVARPTESFVLSTFVFILLLLLEVTNGEAVNCDNVDINRWTIWIVEKVSDSLVANDINMCSWVSSVHKDLWSKLPKEFPAVDAFGLDAGYYEGKLCLYARIRYGQKIVADSRPILMLLQKIKVGNRTSVLPAWDGQLVIVVEESVDAQYPPIWRILSKTTTFEPSLCRGMISPEFLKFAKLSEADEPVLEDVVTVFTTNKIWDAWVKESKVGQQTPFWVGQLSKQQKQYDGTFVVCL